MQLRSFVTISVERLGPEEGVRGHGDTGKDFEVGFRGRDYEKVWGGQGGEGEEKVREDRGAGQRGFVYKRGGLSYRWSINFVS